MTNLKIPLKNWQMDNLRGRNPVQLKGNLSAEFLARFEPDHSAGFLNRLRSYLDMSVKPGKFLNLEIDDVIGFPSINTKLQL